MGLAPTEEPDLFTARSPRNLSYGLRDPNKMTIRNGLYDVEEGVESEEDTHGQAFVA